MCILFQVCSFCFWFKTFGHYEWSTEKIYSKVTGYYLILGSKILFKNLLMIFDSFSLFYSIDFGNFLGTIFIYFYEILVNSSVKEESFVFPFFVLFIFNYSLCYGHFKKLSLNLYFLMREIIISLKFKTNYFDLNSNSKHYLSFSDQYIKF
jgi:hypothetical protein